MQHSQEIWAGDETNGGEEEERKDEASLIRPLLTAE